MKNFNEYIPYSTQFISEDDIQNVVKILKSNYLTQGPTVPVFEEAIKKEVSATNAIAVNSATSALHLACLALDLSKNDYLWTSPITFVASANCARYCGAKIDFVDIDLNTGLISIDSLKNKLKVAEKEGKLPKIVIPVHLAGSSCEMKEIYSLSLKYGFKIIEDASHAIGGKYKNMPVGNCQFSDICVFSFHPVKIITTAEGGLLTTNNDFLANKLKSLRSHGIEKNPQNFEFKSDLPWIYEMQELGYNYRMNDIQASLGISQLKRLKSIIDKRNFVYRSYQKEFSELPIKLLKIPEGVESAVHLCVIQLKSDLNESQLGLFKFLKSQNIGVQVHYSPVHLQPYYKKIGFNYGDFPNSESYAETSLSIPVFEKMNVDIFNNIVKQIKKYFNDLR